MADPVFFEHFEVERTPDGALRELGRGAMGVTYKAFDTNLRRPVCLKVINAASLHSETAQRRFLREARAVARLHHPNVATVFDLGRTGESYFYAMEFVEGETLDARIRREGPLPTALALRITLQVARALGAAWREGLVHRDIKPANLMLARPRAHGPSATAVGDDDDEDDQDGGTRVKVIDFGLARAAGDDEGGDLAALSASGIVGTPYFASPEQLEEKAVDTRSDIYSLGVTLWFMLAGQPPFGGSSVYQVVSQHLQRPPPFETLGGQPPQVLALLGRMLAKEPAERPADPLVLRRELDACLRALPSASRDPAGETLVAKAPVAPDALASGVAGETLLAHAPRVVPAAEQTLLVAPPPAEVEAVRPTAPSTPAETHPSPVILVSALIFGALLLAAGVFAWQRLKGPDVIGAAIPAPETMQNEAPPPTATPSVTPVAVRTPSPLPRFAGATAASRSLAVPSREFPTIGTALEAARPGDTVQVRAGVYGENLRFKDGVRLLGEGAEQTTVRAPAASGPALLVQNCRAGQVALLGFEYAGNGGRALSTSRTPAVLLENSAVDLVQCRVRDAGVTSTAGDRSHILDCEVSGANGSGILVTGANTAPTLSTNRSHHNRSHGLHWTEGGGGTAEGNVCEQNSGAGLAIEDPNTAPTLTNNTATGNLTAGILYRRGAGGIARGNTAARNTGSGVDVAGAGTAPTLENNRCEENQAWGILVQPPAAPVLAGDNRTDRNRVGGVSTRP